MRPLCAPSLSLCALSLSLCALSLSMCPEPVEGHASTSAVRSLSKGSARILTAPSIRLVSARPIRGWCSRR
jgi:hypothetical protein